VSVRICRPTPAKSFIIGGKAAGMIYEFDSTGKKIWECNAGGEPYMALRLQSGATLISTGYGAQMVLADKQGAVIKKFPTLEDKSKDSLFWKAANPNFFAGFQILHNGNIVVANWQGHGAGHGASGFQLIEIDSALTKVVTYWKQNASMVSSLHGVIVLDSFDTKVLHSDYNGMLAPLSDPVKIGASQPARLQPTRTCRAAPIYRYDLQGRLCPSRPMHRCFIEKSRGAMSMRIKVVVDNGLQGN
jgi:hypothetical protein